jgi:cbb3-type cytochrome oxidase subunit 3
MSEWLQHIGQWDFATVKAVCASIGLVIFVTVFVCAALWVYRPGAKKHYQDQARQILND